MLVNLYSHRAPLLSIAAQCIDLQTFIVSFFVVRRFTQFCRSEILIRLPTARIQMRTRSLFNWIILSPRCIWIKQIHWEKGEILNFSALCEWPISQESHSLQTQTYTYLATIQVGIGTLAHCDIDISLILSPPKLCRRNRRTHKFLMYLGWKTRCNGTLLLLAHWRLLTKACSKHNTMKQVI